MSSSNDMIERVKEIIAEAIMIAPQKITPETNFVSDLNVDSLAAFDIRNAVEQEFDLDIPDSDIFKLLSFQDVIDYIEEKSQSR